MTDHISLQMVKGGKTFCMFFFILNIREEADIVLGFKVV